jgi:hypothetical protein
MTGTISIAGVADDVAISFIAAMQGISGKGISFTADGGGLPLRQVATRGRIPVVLNNATPQSMSKSFHFNRSGGDITALGVRLPHWFVPESQVMNTETLTGGPCTFEASVEFPIGGTRKRLTFGGQDSETVADNSDIDTDIITLDTPIPNNAQFSIWVYRSGMVNMPFWTSRFINVNGDQMMFGDAVANVVVAGTLTSSTGSPGYSPSAIFARSNCRAAFLFGDSRCMGTNDTADATGDIGEIARSVGPTLPYINGGVGSTRGEFFVAGAHDKRLKLATDFCTSEICNYAVNDLGANRTAIQIQADVQNIHALFGGLKKFHTTCYVSSTGTWNNADGSDQTTQTYNAQRLAWNAIVKSNGISGIDGFFDSTPAVALNGDDTIGKWIGGQGFTVDGLHASLPGTLAIQAFGAINTALL